MKEGSAYDSALSSLEVEGKDLPSSLGNKSCRTFGLSCANAVTILKWV
jgi:hypothetical protein